MDASKQRVIPGGALDPDQVVGRERLLAELIDRLEVQSVLLVAERRSGKTSVLRLLQHEAPTGWTVVKLSVEGVTSPEEFVRRLAEATTPLMTTTWKDKLIGELDRFGITAIGGLQRRADAEASPSWKEALAAVLVALHATDKPVVLLLDEFPFMLDAVARQVDKAAARDILNVLREAREQHDRLRLVLTGSIGLHHVLEEVRDGSWAPINDLAVVTVTPLDPDPATALAIALLQNEGVECAEDITLIADAIIEVTECVPYYVHLLIGRLKHTGRAVTIDGVKSAFTEAVDDPQDPWSLRHLERRLGDYYGPEQNIAAAILDAVAVNGEVDFRSLMRVMSSSEPPVDEGTTRRLLEDLQRDHYLVRSGAAFAFRLTMMRRVWISLRYIEVSG